MTKKIKGPIKAIRAKCLDCCCGQSREVAACPSDDCSLFPFRFGKNPNRSGIGNRRAVFARKPELTEGAGDTQGRAVCRA